MMNSQTVVEPGTGTHPPDTGWHARHLLDLFVRPARFFASRQPWVADELLVLVAYIAGVNSTIGRIEQRMMRADAGGEALPPFITESWMGFWITVLLVSVISGIILWNLGAWWYKVRLNWCGAGERDSERARVVFLYSRMVWALPALLLQVIDTFRFGNYVGSWNDESLVPLLMLPFPFWSFAVSYRGVRTVFDVRGEFALWWFLMAPSIVLLFALGAVGAVAAGLIDWPSP